MTFQVLLQVDAALRHTLERCALNKSALHVWGEPYCRAHNATFLGDLFVNSNRTAAILPVMAATRNPVRAHERARLLSSFLTNVAADLPTQGGTFRVGVTGDAAIALETDTVIQKVRSSNYHQSRPHLCVF